jgi:hypothetical protein
MSPQATALENSGTVLSSSLVSETERVFAKIERGSMAEKLIDCILKPEEG